jgi:hypothetical protein
MPPQRGKSPSAIVLGQENRENPHMDKGSGWKRIRAIGGIAAV